MNYAIIETNGKQYKVSAGSVIEAGGLEKNKNEKCVFDKVLLYVNKDEALIGKPYVSDVKIIAKIIENFKSEKIEVLKFKAKSRYRRKQGSRRGISRVEIEKIEAK